MEPSRRRIRPDSSGYFTGRNQVPSKDVNKKTRLMGRTYESGGKAFLNTLSRWAFIMRHPKIYLQQRKQDRDRRRNELAAGEFTDARNITDRKISTDLDHMQAVTKQMHTNIIDDAHGKGIKQPGFDPAAENLDELEHVQKVRVGFWDDVPGLSNPKDAEERAKLDELKEKFNEEREAHNQRNISVADRFSDLKNEHSEMKELEKAIAGERQEHNKIVKLLIQMDKQGTDTVLTDEGRKYRKDLDQQRIDIKESIASKNEILANMRVEYSHKTDEVRENIEVMTAVHNDMNEWMQSSDDEYNQLWQLLEKFPSFVDRLGGKEVAARMAKGDQLMHFRQKEIGGLERKFLDAKGDESLEKDLGKKIYAKRLMAMRMDEMIREADTPEALQERVERYTEKKPEPRLASLSRFSNGKEALSESDPFAYEMNKRDEVNWGKGDWDNTWEKWHDEIEKAEEAKEEVEPATYKASQDQQSIAGDDDDGEDEFFEPELDLQPPATDPNSPKKDNQ
ncbi:hypothetical protein NX722_04165 [Endozoicomonas gorgoniicola]|uniref:Uncharacterized protein n=1 Tax=Endozoicomonas gorgoniicola TaxID=1234144 RepID=A0ABT3MR68_9GAMM|nr:hypothetical protein [Endozoicomonas gorgoniicola]MCW7551847.1 hypothetical protein [Endozoicomonas gorgoniicola]